MSRTAFTAALAAAAMAASSAFAAAEAPLQISYPTDGALSCEALIAETGRMDVLLGATADAASKAAGAGQAAGLANTVAVEGLMRSGALGRVPGLGMFANAAGGAAKRKAEADKARAEQAAQTATARRAVLMGIYQGKNCQAQQVAAAVAAATAAPAATAATVTPVAAK